MKEHLQVGLVSEAALFGLRFSQLDIGGVEPNRCRGGLTTPG